MLSRGSPGHPGILPWCPLRHSPPCCLQDPLDIPGSSLGVPSHQGPHAVQRIPWTSQDPPLVSLRHGPPCCLEDTLDIPGPSLVSLQTQAPMLSGGFPRKPGILPWCPLRHRPPCCPEDLLVIPGSSLDVLSDTGPHAVRRIPWTSRDPPLVFPHTRAPVLS